MKFHLCVFRLVLDKDSEGSSGSCGVFSPGSSLLLDPCPTNYRPLDLPTHCVLSLALPVEVPASQFSCNFWAIASTCLQLCLLLLLCKGSVASSPEWWPWMKPKSSSPSPATLNSPLDVSSHPGSVSQNHPWSIFSYSTRCLAMLTLSPMEWVEQWRTKRDVQTAVRDHVRLSWAWEWMTLLRRGSDYREVTRVEEFGKCF